ncbi:hypothetical protein [Devosia sp. MC521]|uniref:hypothetical protein n=1 Tax=Devosia sp. MC521 TaxID=2759954 RepID=UPI0015FD8DFB|nr:hypothetical protein [Devosia sp. MC521]MBJ6987285.1 hypothetical protein [Devosia sp. MC521]QMW64647.1 hypothetical protein H4N61_00530 [Devosia sp. MC521]
MQPDARTALRTILSRIMDDVDPDKHSWAEREKYSRLIETLANPTGTDPGIRVPISLVKRVPEPVPEKIISFPNGADIQTLTRSAVQDAMIDDRARKPFSAFVDGYLASKALSRLASDTSRPAYLARHL